MPNVLVTGANRGIGLELCRQLAARGERVIAVCRRSSAALERLGVRVESGVDLARGDALARLAGALAGTRLDVLINNAGVLIDTPLQALDCDAVRDSFEVNALGPLRLTAALLPCLGPGAKIAMITSRMGSIADNTSGGFYAYRMSKAALNAAAVSLARDLAAQGVAVAVLHPGYVRTDMTDLQGNIDPPEAARGLLARIDALTLETSGGFWHANGETLPW